MADFTFKIEEYIGVLQKKANGWSKEINLINWNNSQKGACYDIREWSPDHTKCSKGSVLSPSEMHRLVKLMEGRA